MARAIWTGTIGFGLVQIPVGLHSAEDRSELEMTMLDKRDFSPVGYEHVNKKTGKQGLLLRFTDELRDAKGLDLPSTNLKTAGVTPKELSMAERLIDGRVSKFEPEKYEDEYRRDLQRLIQRKAKAGELNRIPEAGRRQPKATAAVPQSIDLVELLTQSVHGDKRPPRAANHNDRVTPKSKVIKARAPRSKATKARVAKVHTETQHRKSA